MKKRPSMNRRALFIFIAFSIVLFSLTYRFFVIQITGEANGKSLKAYAEEKYSKERTLQASRGSILDRSGDPLAIDTITYKVVAILDPSVTPDKAKTPKHVVDPEKTAKILAKYIPMKESEIYNRLTKDLFQVEFGDAGKNITNELKRKIEAEKLPGITFIRESKRSYPNGAFASHLLGFANFVDDGDGHKKLIGQMGLEGSLNKYLEGHDGKITYKSDRWGYILPTSTTKISEPKNGSNVYLTIDKKIQTFIEDAMNEVDKQYKPKKMMAIVADAKTGAILGMSQRPTFNPNTRKGIENNWQNIIVENAYEPGSTMKIFTLAASMQEGVWNPNETYQSGIYNVKGAPPIKDHNNVGWGKITFLEGIQRSSNVAVSNLVEKMGTDTFRNYLDKFKFGQKTGIELENEATGTIQYQWERDRISTGYGQATSVTALQMIQALTAVTNKGKMMRPYLIDKIVDEDGKVIKESNQKEVASPISEDTAKKVIDVLESTVTSEHGTAKNFNIDGYQVAGKTGTAQIYENGKGYLTGFNNYLFSFIGFAPTDDPKLIVYVLVQQPDLNQEVMEAGSVPVSKIFNPVMKNSLQYLNIKPDESVEKVKVNSLPDYTSANIGEVKSQLKSFGLQSTVIGNGTKVERTYPSAGAKLLNGERVIIVTDGKWKMPNIVGWSLSDVMKLVNATNMKVSTEGEGFVTSQNLEPGTVITKDSNLKVKLQTQIQIDKGKMTKKEKTNTDGKKTED